MVWHHSLNHCSLKYLIRLFKRGVIPRKLSKDKKLFPCVNCLFGKSYKRSLRTKEKRSGGLIRKPSKTRLGAMNSIDQMVSSQPGLIPQVTGALPHVILWVATVFLDHYSNYFFAHLMRETSAE